ncbi:MAG: sporulation protein YqfD [Firmicutes bacterium]|nr:sporulation protein YqfD [Bacillota bacterium]
MTLLGRARVKAEGLNQLKLISAALKKNIKLYRAEQHTARIYTYALNAADLPEFNMLAQGLGIAVTAAGISGPAGFFRALRVRPVLAAGLALSIALIFLNNSFIWRIEIPDTENIPASEIAAVVRRQCGLRAGTPIRKIDKNEISRRVFDSVGTAAFVDVSVVGTTLLVSVREAVPTPEKDDALESPDIVAVADAVILAVTAVSGTPLVGPGDIVRRGQTLVAGYRTDTAGDNEMQTPVRAVAKVYAKVVYYNHKMCFPYAVTYRRTGVKTQTRSLIVRGKKFFGKEPAVPFAFYETEYHETYAAPGNFLPLRVGIKTVYELKPDLAKSDVSTARRLGMETLRFRVPEDAIVLKEYDIVSDYMDAVRITSVIETERNIATRAY